MSSKLHRQIPEGVQVVEGGVSFPFSFQFFTRLAAVFAEEVGNIDDQHDLAFVRLKRGVSRERALLG
jgi:hypothetical protein